MADLRLAPLCPWCNAGKQGDVQLVWLNAAQDSACECQNCGLRGPIFESTYKALQAWRILSEPKKPKKEGKKEKLRLAKARVKELEDINEDLQNQILSMKP